MDHIEKHAPVKQPEVASQRIPPPRRNQRNSLFRAVESFKDIEQGPISSYRRYSSVGMGFHRKLGCMSRIASHDCLLRKLMQTAKDLRKARTALAPARVRVYDGKPVLSQGFIPLPLSTRYRPPTSLRHSGRR
jgi:hypothetical protein